MWRTVQFFVRKGGKQAAKINADNIRQPSLSRNNITGPEHVNKNMEEKRSSGKWKGNHSRRQYDLKSRVKGKKKESDTRIPLISTNINQQIISNPSRQTTSNMDENEVSVCQTN